MGFLSKVDKQDKWKNKYLNLLDAQEQTARVSKEKEELLCKTIVRLSFAAAGFDPQLDKHMQRLRNHLKNGIDSNKLKTELENFGNLLTQLNDISAKAPIADATLLFDFLLEHTTSPRQGKALGQLKDKYAQQPLENPQQLFSAVLEIIEPEATRQSESDSQSSGLLVDQIDTEIVGKQLLRLLEDLEIPLPFEPQASILKQQLADHPAAEPFEALLEQSTVLILKIKHHIQAERQEIDSFLSQITDKLTALGLAVTGANTAAMESAENRNKLDQSVSEQMQDLQQRSITATQLEPLKEIINTRLASITRELQEHNKKEALQRQKSQQQLDELTRKIKAMETESSQLQSKLMLAKTQALRDTLTGLPNRLAYDERLNAELARWRRYRSPLSLIIWDIDHFKRINDDFGHKAGDKTLAIIAKQLSSHCRQTDFIARFGGEEFTMLLPDTEKQSALKVANQLRFIIEQTGFNSGGNAISITISCGITEFAEGDSPETAFERADQALYQAKQQGRNRCCLA
jgi:diguanylate cyclase